MVRCADLEDLVADYLKGQLGALEQHEVERHLAGCGACREFVAAYVRTAWIAKVTIGYSNRLTPVPEALVQSILEALRS